MNRIIKLMCLALVLVTITVRLVGCNTIEGAGKDIERGGEEIQEAAD